MDKVFIVMAFTLIWALLFIMVCQYRELRSRVEKLELERNRRQGRSA